MLARYTGERGVGARRDEMLDSSDEIRPFWRGVGQALSELGSDGLQERRTAIARLLEDDGVSYRAHGAATKQAWNLDPVPMLIDEPEWAQLEPGLVQRAEVLDAILTDLYGERRRSSDGLLPPELIFAHPAFLRAVDGIRVPGERQLFFSAADLARDSEGGWRVLTDRTQAPSGAGYAMENRSVLSRALPGLYRGTGVHRIAPFYRTMRQSLQRVAPAHADSQAPRVVLLSPGPESETAFDQAFLSSLLGLPLTVAADLTVRDGRVWQRSLHRLERVDVILRRVDADFCDPLELRPDSHLGVPGLLEAARNGAVSIVNSLGAGVLENPGLFPFLERICQVLLDQPLRLPSAQTWWCGDRSSASHVLANLDSLVIKPTSRSVASASRLGWQLSTADRDRLRRRIEAEPQAWVGQEPLAMSTVPTLQPGGLDSRPLVLRTFGVANENSYELMPGGLCRSPRAEDTVVINSAGGAVSKDVWVLSNAMTSGEEAAIPGLVGPETVSAAVSPRVAEDMYWLGRYAERAESTARLLRVFDNRWRDVHPDPDAALARCVVTLLQAITAVTSTWPGFVGLGAGARLSAPQPEILSLLADETRTGTLAYDLVRVRQLANSVRDQLSADTWTVLSGLDRSLLPFRDQTLDAAPAGLAHLTQAMLAFSGLVAESMVRDAGWYLLDAGRRVERGLQVVGLLRHTLDETHSAETQNLLVESVLIAAESVITHRRRYPARGGVESVLELLLTDVGNPRSLGFGLERLAEDLAQTSGPDSAGEAVERVAGLRARVAAIDLPRLATPTAGEARRPELATELDVIAAELRAIHQLIDALHFTKQGALQPLDPFALLEPA